MSTHRRPPTPSRIDPLLRPIQAFLSAESAGGVLLLGATIAALAWANSPWSQSYSTFWHRAFDVGVGSLRFTTPLEAWVNEGLMAVFFLLVGLEIKRELVFGELASVRKATLPAIAALGGMLVPAGIYALLNHDGGSAAAGWGIPMATDIAFAVGVLAMVGRSLPTSIKVFLLAVAIVDDLGAVLVIAFFYTHGVAVLWLAVAGAVLVALAALNVLRIRRPLPYLLLGVALWVAMLASGVHATIAGVLLAFAIPATRHAAEQTPDEPSTLAVVEHALLRPVNFVIVPIFALANAGIDLHGAGTAAFHSPVTWGIIAGLVLGKPIGVLLFSWIAIRTSLGTMPGGATLRQFVGVACLCGIGFTMSLFVSALAFGDHPVEHVDAKLGIFVASLVAAGLGSGILVFARVSHCEGDENEEAHA